jgi:hypothetical protein
MKCRRRIGECPTLGSGCLQLILEQVIRHIFFIFGEGAVARASLISAVPSGPICDAVYTLPAVSKLLH